MIERLIELRDLFSGRLQRRTNLAQGRIGIRIRTMTMTRTGQLLTKNPGQYGSGHDATRVMQLDRKA